jgi:hypothetical protein
MSAKGSGLLCVPLARLVLMQALVLVLVLALGWLPAATGDVSGTLTTTVAATPSNTQFDSLPEQIRKHIKLTDQGPIGYSFECRIRSMSSRTVNVTHIPGNGDQKMYWKLQSMKMLSLRISVNDTMKFNEILLFGEGDDATEMLGEDLAFHVGTVNSVCV